MRYAFYEEHAPQLRSSRTTIVSNEDTWLSYKDAILDNINAPEKSQFENAYARELSRLESVGTWDATAPRPAHSLAPEAIIDTNFEFNTNSNGEKCCRVVQEGVS
ncbi:KLTH0B04686p [Lachancea thermotolerans CBS 6340]|uniref:KLTH0B04686p n=1 Tax=Lachancea thermotolerans (strain ATCC 56472 / CBS 6340 / NRRL Y-8284) TaxID=559295 RepID=C5DCP2_LACTC|nr:KLTH0B04686p [Lachancea thermotolerans CBS 6340]CAR21553.1 KLTH0B04686p [Lachancea thermotolerans CBS 6340]